MRPTGEFGPLYSVPLIESLPIGAGMLQAMPSRSDLEAAKGKHTRLVAGYEVLLSKYQALLAAPSRDELGIGGAR